MIGPEQLGKWSSLAAPNCGKEHRHLVAGRRYQVIKAFSDFDRGLHQPGEEWTFLGFSFLPYEDGMSFFVSLDGLHEWMIRLQWRAEEQGEILDNLEQYLAPTTGC